MWSINDGAARNPLEPSGNQPPTFPAIFPASPSLTYHMVKPLIWLFDWEAAENLPRRVPAGFLAGFQRILCRPKWACCALQ